MDKCPPGPVYFILSVAARVVCAIGSSMGLSYAIVGKLTNDPIFFIVITNYIYHIFFKGIISLIEFHR